MRRQVPRQIALLNERLAALLALVRFLTGMGPLVDHQLPLPNERQRAETALMGLLARMCRHLVPLPVRRVREHFIAELALVWPDSGVAPFVRQELRLDPERELANFTFPRFLVRVRHGVVLIVTLPGKRFTADFATERSIRLVHNHVVLQDRFGTEALLTNITLVRLDSEMFIFVILQLSHRFHLHATCTAGVSCTGIGLSLRDHVPQKTSIITKASETNFAAIFIRIAVVLELVSLHTMVPVHVRQQIAVVRKRRFACGETAIELAIFFRLFGFRPPPILSAGKPLVRIVMQQKRSLKVKLLIAQLAGVHKNILNEPSVNLQRHGFDKPPETSIALVRTFFLIRFLELAMALVAMIQQLLFGDEGSIASAATDHILSADVDYGYFRHVRIVSFGSLLKQKENTNDANQKD